MSVSHFDNVCRVIAREMVAAGLSATVAPAPAALAASRILAGEQPTPVILELTERYRAQEAVKPKAEPVTAEPEPMHLRFAREAKATSDKPPALDAGNPWQGGQVNITRQVMIEHSDPALAQRLKAEAVLGHV